MQPDKKTDQACYITGWCLIGILIIYLVISKITEFHISRFMFPCVFYSWTGLYCPGCGGTRAVISLFKGHLIRSFICHPMVLYTAVTGGCFMLSQTIERLSKGKLKIGMHFSDKYLWIALVLIAVNFAAKNIALIVFHTDLLTAF